jgi:hypothetical protein
MAVHLNEICKGAYVCVIWLVDEASYFPSGKKSRNRWIAISISPQSNRWTYHKFPRLVLIEGKQILTSSLFCLQPVNMTKRFS